MQILDINKSHRVLEVGCGSGYLTALLAKLSYMLETCDIHLDFVNHTKHKLKSIGRYNVKYHQGDAFSKIALTMFEGQYDVIILSPKVDMLPQMYLEKIAPGGKLIYFLKRPTYAKAIVVRRSQQDGYEYESVFDVYRANDLGENIKSSDAFEF